MFNQKCCSPACLLPIISILATLVVAMGAEPMLNSQTGGGNKYGPLPVSGVDAPRRQNSSPTGQQRLWYGRNGDDTTAQDNHDHAQVATASGTNPLLESSAGQRNEGQGKAKANGDGDYDDESVPATNQQQPSQNEALATKNAGAQSPYKAPQPQAFVQLPPQVQQVYHGQPQLQLQQAYAARTSVASINQQQQQQQQQQQLEALPASGAYQAALPSLQQAQQAAWQPQQPQQQSPYQAALPSLQQAQQAAWPSQQPQQSNAAPLNDASVPGTNQQQPSQTDTAIAQSAYQAPQLPQYQQQTAEQAQQSYAVPSTNDSAVPDTNRPQQPEQTRQASSGSSLLRCGFVSDPATNTKQCYGGWKCGCFVSEPTDFHSNPQMPSHPYHTQPQEQPAYQPWTSAGQSHTMNWHQPNSILGFPTSYGLGGGTMGSAAYEAHARCKRQAGGATGYANRNGYVYCYRPAMWYCFTADTRVRRSDGRLRRMDELRVGEWVLSSDGSDRLGYGVVESWAHREPELLADFVQLTLADKKRLKLTEKHLIYKTRCSTGSPASSSNAGKRLVYADEVLVGDCLYTVVESLNDEDNSTLVEMEVVAVDMVQERGIYSPLTPSGDIVVEGILASTFTLVPHRVPQDVAFRKIKTYEQTIRSILAGESSGGGAGVESDLGSVELPFGLASMAELLKGVIFPALEVAAS